MDKCVQMYRNTDILYLILHRNTEMCYTAGMKNLSRLTLDMEPSLHLRLKLLAANQQTTIRALILAWIEEKLPEAEQAEQKRKG